MKACKLTTLVYLCSLMLLTLFAGLANASLTPHFLAMGEAFKVTGSMPSAHSAKIHFAVAPGYHLYRDKIRFETEDATLGKPKLPAAVIKNNPILGKLAVYDHNIDIIIPITQIKHQPVTLTVHYQGCAEAGFCYPPQKTPIELTVPLSDSDEEATIMPASYSVTTPVIRDFTLFENHSLTYTLIAFLGFGLLLAFTPCVLPLIPVMFSIIVGQHNASGRSRDFLLSLTFVLAMATGYAIAGIFAGYLGYTLQSVFQSPWALVFMSSLFVILAFSLFGFYNLTLPGSARIHAVSQRQRGGTYVGVAIMGVLSILVVSPCIAPPLAAALTYIGKTGNVLFGGLALFVLGLGMGLPLLMLGLFGERFLPKAGPWMHLIKMTFGVFLLVLAIELLSRIIPGFVSLALWGILCIITAVFMAIPFSVHTHFARFNYGLASVLFIYGVLLLVGASLGHVDPWQPLRSNIPPVNNATTPVPAFTTVKSLSELKSVLATAQHHKPVVVDFYADWCANCVAMEKSTFTPAILQTALRDFTLIRADLTMNDDASIAMQKTYNVFAPPSLLFFDINGKELKSARMVGYVSLEQLKNQIEQNQAQLFFKKATSMTVNEEEEVIQPTYAILDNSI